MPSWPSSRAEWASCVPSHHWMVYGLLNVTDVLPAFIGFLSVASHAPSVNVPVSLILPFSYKPSACTKWLESALQCVFLTAVANLSGSAHSSRCGVVDCDCKSCLLWAGQALFLDWGLWFYPVKHFSPILCYQFHASYDYQKWSCVWTGFMYFWGSGSVVENLWTCNLYPSSGSLFVTDFWIFITLLVLDDGMKL